MNRKYFIIFLLLLGLLTGCARSSADSVLSALSDSTVTADPKETPASETKQPAQSDIKPEEISEPEEEDLLEGVILGRSVFLHYSGVAFWGADGYLCSALTDASGGLYDFIIEGELSTNIWSVAISGDDCFLATSAGFLQFSLSEFEQGSAELLIVNKEVLLDGFSVYNDKIYFLNYSSLSWFSMTDTEPEQLLSGVEDYEITTQGIYYTDEDGGLFLKSFDGSQRELLLDTPEHTHFTIHGQTVYYWTEDGSVYQWTAGTDAPERISLRAERDPNTDVWVTAEYLVYTDVDDDVYSYNFSSGSETSLDGLYLLPEKCEGFLQDDILYYRYSSAVYWSDLLAGKRVRTALEDFADVSASTPQPGNNTQNDSSSGFDMSNGLGGITRQGYTAIYNDYFSLELPAIPAWDYEIIDKNTIKFYYCAGRDSGYDGTFLTIKAYDWGDNDYADLPSYSIAGLDADKKYIAIFPTDVRFDPTDETQREEYNILFSAVQQIDYENNPDNITFTILNP